MAEFSDDGMTFLQAMERFLARRHHHHHQHNHGRVTVSLNLRPGQTATLTAMADDPAGAADPNASVSFISDDTAGTICTVSPATATTAKVAYVGPGTANIIARVTDPDGNTVDSAPFEIICDVATDASTVTVSGSVDAASSGTGTPGTPAGDSGSGSPAAGTGTPAGDSGSGTPTPTVTPGSTDSGTGADTSGGTAAPVSTPADPATGTPGTSTSATPVAEPNSPSAPANPSGSAGTAQTDTGAASGTAQAPDSGSAQTA